LILRRAARLSQANVVVVLATLALLDRPLRQTAKDRNVFVGNKLDDLFPRPHEGRGSHQPRARSGCGECDAVCFAQ
jgi:hypothetical protein